MTVIASRLELRQLRYFIAVVNAGSISGASQIVHVAQPALSQQMLQLEEIVGTQLLVRSRLGVKPTPSGDALYRHAQAIIRLVDETRANVLDRGLTVTGRVRLNLPSSIAVVLAAPLLRAVYDAFPGVRLELHESPSAYLAAQLIDERFDLSILVDAVPRDGIRLTPLLEEMIFFVAIAPLPGVPPGTAIPLRLTANMPMIMPTLATTLRQILNGEFAKEHIVPVVYGEVSSIPSMLLLVSKQRIGTFVPGAALSEESRSAFNIYPIDPAIRRRATLAQSLSRPLSVAAEEVRKLLIETVSRLAAEGRWLGATLCPEMFPEEKLQPHALRGPSSALS
jgi:LysR family nitrogen assimilation transcriptional regulator